MAHHKSSNTLIKMLKLLSIILISLSLSIPVQATSAKIYVWRNEQGVLVFSDTPRPGAEEVDIKETNTLTSSFNTSTLDIIPKVIDEKYHVEIIQPTESATIRDNTGSVYVSGRIKPIFKRGLSIQLYLDDKPYEKPQTHSMFKLKNLDRGEHQVKMQVLNDKGKVIASSAVITFYMHRASQKNAN